MLSKWGVSPQGWLHFQCWAHIPQSSAGPPQGQAGVTGIQRAEHFNSRYFMIISIYLKAVNWQQHFTPTETDLENHTEQKCSVLWQGHCASLGTKTQLWQKSALSLCYTAGIQPGRQARVCPFSPTHSISGFKEILPQAKLWLLSPPSSAIPNSSLALALY